MKILQLNFLIVYIIISTRMIVTSSEIEGDLFCSSFCVCDMWYKLRRANCTSKHLYSIETGVSNTVQALDLSKNAISTVLNYDLKNTGLVNLKYLNLSDNSIKEIGSFAFTGLVELAILDLSRNHLYYVLWDTFVDTKNLRILHLDGNRFGTRIPDLHSNSITELSLSNCQIGHINIRTFAGLVQLRKLDLSGNLMIQMDFRELEFLPFLKDINLDNNPWSCSSGMTKDLQTYLDDKIISYNNFCIISQLYPPSSSNVMGMGKKFEKMIDASSNNNNNNNNNNNDGKVIITNNKKPELGAEEIDKKNSWIIDRAAGPFDDEVRKMNEKTKILCKNDLHIDYSKKGLIEILREKISPIWIFAVGFSLGFVISMIITYLWITGIFCSAALSCIKFAKISPIRRRENCGGILRDRIIDDINNSQRISLLDPVCPGTPPPPYRDVIINSSLYPTAPA